VRVIVTRPESEARLWSLELERRGFETAVLALIDIRPAPRPAEVSAAWRALEGLRAVMFVSGNAVRQFFAQRPAGAAWPAATRGWATGAGTREALLEAGVAPALVDAPPSHSTQFDSENLWQGVAAQVKAQDRVLIVRGMDHGDENTGRTWLADQLVAVGAQVESVVAYVRARPQWDDQQRARAQQLCGPESVWLFSSSQAIVHLQSLMPAQAWAAGRAVATHPRIAQTARHAGFAVVCESRPAVDAVAAALESIR
jgi:uroporphyrinogen-III synthase